MSKRDDELEQVFNGNQIQVVFQPIINLADGSVFGYEALSRGPIGTRLESADALFSAAAAVGATQRSSACAASVPSRQPPASPAAASFS